MSPHMGILDLGELPDDVMRAPHRFTSSLGIRENTSSAQCCAQGKTAKKLTEDEFLSD
jgi:hypothetical protein